MDTPIIYDAALWASKDLFETLLAFILLNTGTPLSSHQISKGLKKTLNTSTTNKTAQTYIDKLVGAGILDRVKRQYVKPHYTRIKKKTEEAAICGSPCYFLMCSESELKEIYSCLKSKASCKRLPSFKSLLKKISVYKALKSMFGNVSAGEILFFQRGEDQAITKTTVPVDFFFTDAENQKNVFVFTGLTKIIEKKRDLKSEVFIGALKSLTNTKAASVTFIELYDKEPADLGDFFTEFQEFKRIRYTEIIND